MQKQNLTWLAATLTALVLAASGCAPGRETAPAPGTKVLAIDGSEVELTANKSEAYFDAYILKAVRELYAKYKMLGYDINSVYTHPIQYGPYGLLKDTPGPKTMCVAAQLEIIVTAMDIYARETGDKSVYDFLPKRSFDHGTVNDFRGHVFVNHAFDAYGTADALVNFGMGERVAFENLKPGGFINFDRTRKTGHAVVFLAFIDKTGHEFTTYNSSVVGFKYFSAQGMHDPDGGLDYRYGIFDKFGCPDMPYKKDCGLIYGKNRKTLNVGRMFAPKRWNAATRPAASLLAVDPAEETVVDHSYYNGVTETY